MTSREFLDTVREMVYKANMQKIVRVGGDVNEDGDITLRKEADGTIWFFASSSKICPLEDVQYILYKCRREDDDSYDETWGTFKLIFELKENNHYAYDVNEYDIEEELFMDQEYYSGWTLEKAVTKHSQKVARRRNLEYLIASAASIVKDGGEISSRELEIIQREIDGYMAEDPDELQDFLLFYGYTALDMMAEGGKDLFDVKAVLEMLVSKGWKTEFMDYVRERSGNPKDLTQNRTYVTLATTLLTLLHEIAPSENVPSEDTTSNE